MTKFFSRPLFWISFFALSCISALIFYIYLPKAYSIIQIPITMDRHEAIEKGTQLALTNNLVPADGHTAVIFQSDYLVQFFVELDAGGKKAFEAMMKEDLYQPFTWQVRFFKQHLPEEATVIFTSDGKPYGFTQKYSENLPGAQLTVEQARPIAEQGAAQWAVNLAEYKPIEASKEVVASGRIDHMFVYERPDIKIGEGFYRLRIRVSGDKLSELTHFVQVPESFIRKYTQMRSANETLAYYAKIAIAIFYFLGGCILGLLYLMRRRYVLWRAPIIWGSLFIFFMFCSSLNQLPLAWIHYDTAISASGYLMQYIISSLISSFAFGMFFTIIFVAAESLTRYAFGNQVQLWSSWNRGVANSYQVLGRTLGGYLSFSIFLAHAVLFYIIMNNYFGWWSPSSSLFDPNVLATYVPWFDPLTRALEAGFWEECMFRAIPLSVAALLGTRFGKRNWWIATVLVLQAIIFGAGHAWYAQQPFYARIVEMFFPFLIYGIMYLVFGLMTVIISHVLYDLVLFSIPIFVSSGHAALINQGVIILGACIPLFIILFRRYQYGSWISLPHSALNKAWQPPAEQVEYKEQAPQHLAAPFSKRKKFVCFAAGIAGLIIWYIATPHTQQAAPLPNDRSTAMQKGQQAFAQFDIDHTKPWNMLVTAFRNYETDIQAKYQHRFIWQQGGEKVYQQLLGTYLDNPYWIIRFAQFDGPLADRAEEVILALNNRNEVFRIEHKLPEDREGKELSEQEARSLAHSAIAEKFGIDASTLKEISATPTKRPHRTDWTFVFADEHAYPLSAGQARIGIEISGDKLTDYQRSIHVPEDWERKEKDNDTTQRVIILISMALIYLIFCAGCFFAAYGWTHQLPLGKSFVFFFVGMASIGLFSLFNNATSYIALAFNTSQPYQDQWIRHFGSLAFQSVFFAAIFALLIAYMNKFRIPTRLPRTKSNLLIGFSMGAVFAASVAFILSILPQLSPLWANYVSVSAWSPLFDGLGRSITHLVNLTIAWFLIFTIIDFITEHGTKRKALCFGLLLLFGMTVGGIQFADNVPVLIAFGITTGILAALAYYFVFRFDFALIPLATAVSVSLFALQQGMYHAYPAAPFIAVGSIILVMVIGWWWYRNLN